MIAALTARARYRRERQRGIGLAALVIRPRSSWRQRLGGRRLPPAAPAAEPRAASAARTIAARAPGGSAAGRMSTATWARRRVTSGRAAKTQAARRSPPRPTSRSSARRRRSGPPPPRGRAPPSPPSPPRPARTSPRPSRAPATARRPAPHRPVPGQPCALGQGAHLGHGLGGAGGRDLPDPLGPQRVELRGVRRRKGGHLHAGRLQLGQLRLGQRIEAGDGAHLQRLGGARDGRALRLRQGVPAVEVGEDHHADLPEDRVCDVARDLVPLEVDRPRRPPGRPVHHAGLQRGVDVAPAHHDPGAAQRLDHRVVGHGAADLAPREGGRGGDGRLEVIAKALRAGRGCRDQLEAERLVMRIEEVDHARGPPQPGSVPTASMARPSEVVPAW